MVIFSSMPTWVITFNIDLLFTKRSYNIYEMDVSNINTKLRDVARELTSIVPMPSINFEPDNRNGSF